MRIGRRTWIRWFSQGADGWWTWHVTVAHERKIKRSKKFSRELQVDSVIDIGPDTPQVMEEAWRKVKQETDCRYEDVWTDEVGIIPVCVLHNQNSRHEVTSERPNPPCLEIDPY